MRWAAWNHLKTVAFSGKLANIFNHFKGRIYGMGNLKIEDIRYLFSDSLGWLRDAKMVE